MVHGRCNVVESFAEEVMFKQDFGDAGREDMGEGMRMAVKTQRFETAWCVESPKE